MYTSPLAWLSPLSNSPCIKIYKCNFKTTSVDSMKYVPKISESVWEMMQCLWKRNP